MTLTKEEMEERLESLQVHADALLTLSSPAATTTPVGGRALTTEGVFECKTCSKRFPSFQALGGHRTSHTRLHAKMLHTTAAAAAAERDRARVHECAVCGLEFSMGQALGGHMRRHRDEAPATVVLPAASQQETMPDLNYPPLEGGCDGQETSSERNSGPELLNLLL
ncbi:hypothetical protein GUJ93_ZPchr0001g31956 [Zizania palustris]|uniref:C2H2-type domain-containing protein n=1 Tax=Zizania palustris TaxID=103762 RepID=A0A8J5RWR5_ZIZPA|nr:hypothetical protein GUJ93_ZPchr0001g31956 [Zizania palustris]